jgi:tRNA (cmo5U34)-methyltransferase
MDEVRKYFEDDAKIFDERVIKTVPFYVDILDSLVSALPFPETAAIKVIDLGCGTGTLVKKVKKRYAAAR